MNILELQTEIKDTKRKLFELETKLNTYPNFTLMYLLNKGKHTFVLQPTKQVPNLETNGWKKWTIEEFTTFIIDKTNLTFKQQLEMDFIPAIEQMAEKERLHLQWLKSQNAKKEFIEKSAFFLNHLRNRLKEYQEYASKL